MRMRSRAAITLLALGGCYIDDRPTPFVLCHNANCAEPHAVSRDDTVAALRTSLALTGDDGLPLIDGIELDLFRHEGQCLFAHDVEHLEDHVEITEAAAIVAEYIRTHPRASHGGEQFTVKLELKPQVDALRDTDNLITCALDAHTILRDAAYDSGQRVEVVFDSYNPAVLRAIAPRRPPDAELITAKLSIDFGVPPPLRIDNYDLDKLDVDVDIAEIHGGWITDTARRALQSKGVELSVWSFDLTRETLDAIDNLSPRYALTGQAQTLRAWLDR
jgi:hypothetical protein